jgi:hypothetical protein
MLNSMSLELSASIAQVEFFAGSLYDSASYAMSLEQFAIHALYA